MCPIPTSSSIAFRVLLVGYRYLLDMFVVDHNTTTTTTTTNTTNTKDYYQVIITIMIHHYYYYYYYYDDDVYYYRATKEAFLDPRRNPVAVPTGQPFGSSNFQMSGR
jgi:hypothetical protein